MELNQLGALQLFVVGLSNGSTYPSTICKEILLQLGMSWNDSALLKRSPGIPQPYAPPYSAPTSG